MRIIKKKIGEYAELTGYLHELNDETDNIKEYPAILIFPGGGFRTCSFLESELNWTPCQGHNVFF